MAQGYHNFQPAWGAPLWHKVIVTVIVGLAFWEIMGMVYDYEFKYFDGIKATNERKEFALNRKIAFTDMIAKAIRKNDNAGHKQLQLVELTDIISILSTCNSVNRIVLTSRSGEISAFELLRHHLLINNVQVYYNVDAKLIQGFFEFGGKKIKIFVPYSPSPRVLRRFGLNVMTQMYHASLLSRTTL